MKTFKKNQPLYFMIWFLLISAMVSCKKEPDVAVMTMTMNWEYADVELYMTGTGSVTIDWGDGSKRETCTLHPYVSDYWYGIYSYGENYRFAHEYLNAGGSYTAKITGENITHVKCDGLMSIDVSDNTALEWLECYGKLTSLDVSKNTALTYLDCGGNQLTTLDVSNNTALISLYCGSNQLTSLDPSNNTALLSLMCNYNHFTYLNISASTALINLWCGDNQLTTLDVSQNTWLAVLHCYNNQIISLNLSNNTNLYDVICSNNQLTELMASNIGKSYNLSCNSNQLTTEALNKLFGTLPNNNYSGRVYIWDNPGTDSFTNGTVINGWTIITVKRN